MVTNYIVAAVVILVLACLLAYLVAWSLARRKPLQPDGVSLVENIRPGRQRLFQGGVYEGSHAAAFAAASTAASNAVEAFNKLAATATFGPAAVAAAAMGAADATAAAVPVFTNLVAVATADATKAAAVAPVATAAATAPPAVTLQQRPVVADLGSNNPKDIMFGINSEPQAFNLVGQAGKGGVKLVSYIDQKNGDWVLAIPAGSKYLSMWPRMVQEELKMASELHALGIPCMEMYGVMCAPTETEAGVYQGLALKMRSFDNYQRMGKTQIFDGHKPKQVDQSKAIMKGMIDQWMAQGIPYAADRLSTFLAPLIEDIKKLANHCSHLPSDAFNWQIVFDDDGLKIPSQARVFIFDLADLDRERDSFLAVAGESAAVKTKRMNGYLEAYLNRLVPYEYDFEKDVEIYQELDERTRERLGIPPPP
ncbi:MAG: hypothetical protein EB034_00300 [Verrucomicrobia bacterium]|nr:hypothetical protein [Verrucomicrobiota bacterium]